MYDGCRMSWRPRHFLNSEKQDRSPPIAPQPLSSDTPALKRPDPRTKEALVYFVAKNLQNILATMQQGFHDITEFNIGHLETMMKQRNWIQKDVFKKNLDWTPKSFNKPTYFFIEALLKADLKCMIPTETDKCLTIAATANSANPAAPFCAMQLISKNFNEDNWTRWGVAHGKTQENCRTGVGNIHPHQWCVLYDEGTPEKGYVEMSKNMKQQMCERIGKQKFQYMFMHGCIHQQFLPNVQGEIGPSWSSVAHEEWLNCLQLAEMATAVEKLPPGGHLCIKIRNMKLLETYMPVALVATMFDTCKIVAVPAQICQFAVVMFCDKKNQRPKDIQELSRILCECADGNPTLLIEFMQQKKNLPNFKEVLARCKEVGDEMTRYDTVTFEVFAAVVHEIWQNPDITWSEIKKKNRSIYLPFEKRFLDENLWPEKFETLKTQLPKLGASDQELLKKISGDF